MTEPSLSRRAEQGSISVMRTASLLFENRWLLIAIPLLVTIPVVAVVALRGPTYVSTSRFTPEGGNAESSRLLGLASQFGVSLPQGERAGPDFYAELVKSQDLLRDVVRSKYSSSALGDSVPLVDLLESKGDTPEARTRDAIERLRRLVGVTIDQKASLVTVTVAAKSPQVSEQVNRRILARIDEFNLRKRQTRATAERAFVEERLVEAQRELRAAEGALQSFLESNRSYQSSPQLAVVESRLQRQVTAKQAVYTSLTESFERARLEQVRSTPVVTVIDAPEGSARAQRGLKTKATLALVASFAFAVVLVFAREFLRQQRETDPVEYERFMSAYHRSRKARSGPSEAQRVPDRSEGR